MSSNKSDKKLLQVKLSKETMDMLDKNVKRTESGSRQNYVKRLIKFHAYLLEVSPNEGVIEAIATKEGVEKRITVII
jgi:hypothetical protein